MRDAASLAQALLALFVSPERAESIAGDLLEERAARGSVWFWFHVSRIACGLLWRGVLNAPLTAREMVAWGSVLFLVLVLGGVVVPYLFPRVLVRPVSAYQSVEWEDPSRHTVKLVTVEPGVQIEVLDWGGSGRPIVLLAGLGDTAHTFDDFAPILAKQYRVCGITRRGVGASSTPSSGYGFPRLAEDVVRVIEELALVRPVIVGHSFAGEEMHVIGAQHASKAAGLVYVDAAFDRGDDSDNARYDAVVKTLPGSPGPRPSDRASIDAFRAFLRGVGQAALPEAQLRARFSVNADGSIGAPLAPPLAVRQAFTAVMKESYAAYKPTPIKVPAVSLYAAPSSAAELMRMRPWYDAGDAVTRENVEKLYVLTRDRVLGHARWFERFAPGARVVEISGAHHLFITNGPEVLREIQRFVSSLP